MIIIFMIAILYILLQIKDIKDGSGTVTVTDAMKGLSNATDDETLFKGDLTAAVDTLDETAIASNASGRGQDTEEGQEEIYVRPFYLFCKWVYIFIYINLLSVSINMERCKKKR